MVQIRVHWFNRRQRIFLVNYKLARGSGLTEDKESSFSSWTKAYTFARRTPSLLRRIAASPCGLRFWLQCIVPPSSSAWEEPFECKAEAEDVWEDQKPTQKKKRKCYLIFRFVQQIKSLNDQSCAYAWSEFWILPEHAFNQTSTGESRNAKS